MIAPVNLTELQIGTSKRISSYDRSGGNKDYFTVEPGEDVTLAAIEGSGEIRHIWMTTAPVRGESEAFLMRKLVLTAYWDGEETPSVQAPLGDFFGMGHGITRNHSSAMLAMSPENGSALNCFFPMPFGDSARFVLHSDAEDAIKFYFYIDYCEKPIAPEVLRFHALWNRDRPAGADESARPMNNADFEFGGKNTTGADNYSILDAVGSGHYVGCNFNIHNLRMTREWNWYGEGDDMIFIDGEPWPPSLHGTGTEDYFNTAWCPQQEIQTPYHGIIMGGGPNWSGKISTYRYHILDPVIFRKSIRVTIEHGHNNHRSDDLASTAYWYQSEPHRPVSPIRSASERMPLPDVLPLDPDRLRDIFG